MAPESVMLKAHKYRRCHPKDNVIVTDSFKSDDGEYICATVCPRCLRTTMFDITESEYEDMKNDLPWKDENGSVR